MNGLQGGQGRDAQELLDTAHGMWILLLLLGAAAAVAWLVTEVM
jgi:hypothetical protein